MDSRLIEESPALSTGTSARPALRDTVRDFVRSQYERHHTFVKFAAVGTIGYVIYLALLFVMYDRELFPFLPDRHTSTNLGLFTHDDVLLLITTLIGSQLSIIAVFIGHTLWTFADRATVRKTLWLRFAQFQGRAMVSTLGILTVAVNLLTLVAGVHPTLAVPVGLVAAFVWNWLLDSKVIWRLRTSEA